MTPARKPKGTKTKKNGIETNAAKNAMFAFWGQQNGLELKYIFL